MSLSMLRCVALPELRTLQGSRRRTIPRPVTQDVHVCAMSVQPPLFCSAVEQVAVIVSHTARTRQILFASGKGLLLLSLLIPLYRSKALLTLTRLKTSRTSRMCSTTTTRTTRRTMCTVSDVLVVPAAWAQPLRCSLLTVSRPSIYLSVTSLTIVCRFQASS